MISQLSITITKWNSMLWKKKSISFRRKWGQELTSKINIVMHQISTHNHSIHIWASASQSPTTPVKPIRHWLQFQKLHLLPNMLHTFLSSLEKSKLPWDHYSIQSLSKLTRTTLRWPVMETKQQHQKLNQYMHLRTCSTGSALKKQWRQTTTQWLPPRRAPITRIFIPSNLTSIICKKCMPFQERRTSLHHREISTYPSPSSKSIPSSLENKKWEHHQNSEWFQTVLSTPFGQVLSSLIQQ